MSRRAWSFLKSWVFTAAVIYRILDEPSRRGYMDNEIEQDCRSEIVAVLISEYM